MPNLAGERGRQLTQSRITNNRDAVIPTRRNTDAPSVAIRADLRSAARGDGGADELKRTLDAFTGAGADALRAKAVNDLPRRQREADDGALDAQMGLSPGPERDKQVAYQEAYYGVKTQSAYNAFDLDTRTAVDDALDQGATPDEVHDLVVERFTRFRDETLDVLPEGITAARTETVTRLGALGQALEQTTATRIRERTQQDFVTTAQGNIQTSLRSGEPVTFEAYVAQFRQGGLAPADAKKAAIDAVVSVALDRDDPQPELLDQLLNSRQNVNLPPEAYAPQGPLTGLVEAGNIDLTARPTVRNSDGSISTVRSMSTEIDGREVLLPTVSPEGKLLSDEEAIALYEHTGQHLGIFDSPAAATAYAEQLHAAQADAYGRRARATPSLSAAEQLQIEDRITQANSLKTQVEREQHEEARDTLTETLFKDAMAGQSVDDRIKAAALNGTFTPQEASATLGLISGFQNALGDGIANEDFVLEITRRSVLGNPPSNSEILAWEREGRFGTGRNAQKAALQFLSDNASVRRAAAAARGGASANGSFLSAAEEGNRNISTARSFLWDQIDVGDDASRYQSEMAVLADREFNRRVRAGEEPFAVARDVVTRVEPVIRANRPPQGQGRPATQKPTTTVRRGPDGRLVVN